MLAVRAGCGYFSRVQGTDRVSDTRTYGIAASRISEIVHLELTAVRCRLGPLVLRRHSSSGARGTVFSLIIDTLSN